MATTWNPDDKQAGCTLTNGNLTVEFINPGGQDRGLVRAIDIVPNGKKVYWEITADESQFSDFGICTGTHNLIQLIGQDTDPGDEGTCITSAGTKRQNGSAPVSYGNAPSIADGDVVGIAYDRVNDAIWFSVNDVWIDGDGTDSSATVKAEIEAGTTTSAAYTSGFVDDMYAAWSGTDISSIQAKGTANFGESAFNGGVPAGFEPGIGPNLYTWNPADKSSDLTLTNADRTTQDADNAAHRAVRGEESFATDAWYWEITIDEDNGANFEVTVGVGDASQDLDTQLGEDTTNTSGYGYSSDANRHNGGADNAYGATFGPGDVIGVAYNADLEAMWFHKNGTWLDVNGTANSATVKSNIEADVTTNAAFTAMTNDLYPMISVRDAKATANFGTTAFTQTPPAGFSAPSGLTNPVGEAEFDMPMLIIRAVGIQFNAGTIDIEIPMQTIEAFGDQPVLRDQFSMPYDLLLRDSFSFPYDSTDLRSPFSMPYDLTIRSTFSMPYDLTTPVQDAFSMPYDSTGPLQDIFSFPYDLLGINPVGDAFSMPYDSLPAISVINVSDVPFITLGSERIDVIAAAISQDEQSFGWVADFTLAGYAFLSKFAVDTPFTFTVGGEAYSLIVDSIQERRGQDAAREYELSAISPTASLDLPRSERISRTFTNDTLASDIAEDIAGQTIDWQLIDWTVPGGRFSVSNITPLNAIKQLAAAAGGIIETKKNGSLLVRHEYPISIPDYPTSAVAHTFTDLDDNLSVSRDRRRKSVVNKVTIRDSVVGLNQDRIDFVPIDNNNTSGFLKVYPNPFRNVQIIHTGQSTVSVTNQGDEVRTETEVVEIFDGAGTVQFPIESIQNVDWQYDDLGSLTFDFRGTDVRATGGLYSLARVTYTTRAKVFRVTNSVAELVQFLVSDI